MPPKQRSKPARRDRPSRTDRNADGNDAVSGDRRLSTIAWIVLVACFTAGIGLRIAALDLPRYSGGRQVTSSTRWDAESFRQFLENDEKIYVALVEQLESGRGYTLQGHAIADAPWLVGDHYRRELFFHPPGGVALFWLGHRLSSQSGYALVQVACFGLFFWSLVALGIRVIRPFGALAAATLGILGAATPLMAHVAGRFWLDGPLLAFSTLAVALYVAGAMDGRRWLIVAAALALGFATLIKATAVLVALPAIVLAQMLDPRRFTLAARDAGLFLGVAFVVHLPWLVWQWSVLGSPFPAWAGRPPASLVNANPYVRYLTVVRSAWTYPELLPQISWTLVPALILWLPVRRYRDTARVAGALVFWIVLVVGVHMALGATGYSKVMRYAILMVPAGALLFSLGVSRVVEWARQGRRTTLGVWVLLSIAAAGLGLEIAQGLRTSLHDNARMDLVRPLFGVRGVDY